MLPLMGHGCEHVEALDAVASPVAEACQECGSRTVLRVCWTCWHVGCCDSHEAHATKPARESGHPLIRAWKGGAFAYCHAQGHL